MKELADRLLAGFWILCLLLAFLLALVGGGVLVIGGIVAALSLRVLQVACRQ